MISGNASRLEEMRPDETEDNRQLVIQAQILDLDSADINRGNIGVLRWLSSCSPSEAPVSVIRLHRFLNVSHTRIGS